MHEESGLLTLEGQELETGQITDGRFQGFKGFSIQRAVFLTMLCQEGIQRNIPTILLQIHHPIFRHSQHSRNRQVSLLEMLCQVDERFILLRIGAYDSNDRSLFAAQHTEVLTIAASTCQRHDALWLLARQTLI